jgi:hypothetical protein
MIYAVYQIATNKEPYPNKFLYDNGVETFEVWNLDTEGIKKLGLFSENVLAFDLSDYSFEVKTIEEVLDLVLVINETASISADNKIVADFYPSEIPAA